jgi:hypothetical protein
MTSRYIVVSEDPRNPEIYGIGDSPAEALQFNSHQLHPTSNPRVLECSSLLALYLEDVGLMEGADWIEDKGIADLHPNILRRIETR